MNLLMMSQSKRPKFLLRLLRNLLLKSHLTMFQNNQPSRSRRKTALTRVRRRSHNKWPKNQSRNQLQRNQSSQQILMIQKNKSNHLNQNPLRCHCIKNQMNKNLMIQKKEGIKRKNLLKKW